MSGFMAHPTSTHMVCGVDVCDESNEYSSDAYVNECEGEYTDEVTGVTLLRDDVDQGTCTRDGG